MMASAASLKQRYSSKWKKAAVREKVVYEWLRYFAARLGLEVYAAGIGTLKEDYVPGRYSGLEDKYDFILYSNGKPALFFDVTGNTSSGRRKAYGTPCFLSVKLELALKYNVADRVILIHVNDKTGAIRWVTASHLLQLVKKGYARIEKLYHDERPYYCIPVKHMNYLEDLEQFIALKVMN